MGHPLSVLLGPDEADLDAFSDDLVGAVRETRQPANVSLWLHSDDGPKQENKPVERAHSAKG
jgi:hypothetical protein